MNKEESKNCKKYIDIEENTVHLLLDCDNLAYLIWNELDKAVKKNDKKMQYKLANYLVPYKT